MTGSKKRGLRRATSAIVLCAASATLTPLACGPSYGEQPFLCEEDGACPEGYTCRATVCELDGSAPTASRPLRATWINSAELYWFASADGGATLVVNEGFTQGRRALYEVHVTPDGAAGDARVLLDLREDFPTSTAVFALDDDAYGVLAVRFPGISEAEQHLDLFRVERDAPDGEEPDASTLYSSTVAFLGGTEPAYVSAIKTDAGVETCFVDPSAGGTLHVRRIVGGDVDRDIATPLPPSVLPLSGDCLIWAVGDDLVVRLGLEVPVLYRVPADATTADGIEGPISAPGLVVYPFEEGVASLVLDPIDGDEEMLRATLATTDWAGDMIDSRDLGEYPLELEPHTAWASADEVLFAPASSTASFSDLEIFSLSPDGSNEVASVERAGTDTLYSARAFETGGKVYIAWTALHGDLMDLWVTTTEASP